MDTTRIYYRVGAQRQREAVDKVARHQFDRNGKHIWRQAQALLDAEHARRAVGQIAVPYGTCNEPTNVQAGGGACPFRFRCVGCDHLRTDVSYLPDIGDLHRRNTELEQHVVRLRHQLGEKDDDLGAARMTNRELMASLNRSTRASF